MCGFFSECQKVKSLPDISKWFNTSNIKQDLSIKINEIQFKMDQYHIISEINYYKGLNFSYMFYNCESLISLPDISNWNTDNIIDMSKVFNECSSLLSIPDISKWNTSKVKDMSYLFSGCYSLSKLPDISKWDTKNVIKMNGMFNGCSSIVFLPNISIWKIDNLKEIDLIFYGCTSLLIHPDISKWNFNKIKNIDLNSEIEDQNLYSISINSLSKKDSISIVNSNSDEDLKKFLEKNIVYANYLHRNNFYREEMNDDYFEKFYD